MNLFLVPLIKPYLVEWLLCLWAVATKLPRISS